MHKSTILFDTLVASWVVENQLQVLQTREAFISEHCSCSIILLKAIFVFMVICTKKCTLYFSEEPKIRHCLLHCLQLASHG